MKPETLLKLKQNKVVPNIEILRVDGDFSIPR